MNIGSIVSTIVSKGSIGITVSDIINMLNQDIPLPTGEVTPFTFSMGNIEDRVDSAIQVFHQKTVLHMISGRAVLIYFASDIEGRLRCVRCEPLGKEETVVVPPQKMFAIKAKKNTVSTFIKIGIEGNNGESRIPLLEDCIAEISRLEEKVDTYYYGYDDRYQKVYDMGAFLWETEKPNEILIHLLKKYPEYFRGDILDLGCGEGRDTIYLSSRGHRVLGVDISSFALNKGREIAQRKGLDVRFICSDVIYLRNFERNSYDSALNLGCLHMLHKHNDRRQHLQNVFKILRPGGVFIVAHCKENWGNGFFSIPQKEEIGPLHPGTFIERRIRTPDGHKMIPLEVLHYKESQGDKLSEELTVCGFAIEALVEEDTDAFGDTVVIIARKPI